MSAPQVSDHALMRFLSRAGGVDVEGLRARLANGLEAAHVAARSVSASDYLIKVDGHMFVVRGEVVTTVLDDNGPAATFHALRQRGSAE